MSVDPERDHAVHTFERPRIVGAWSSECGVDVDLVEVTDGAFVFLKMAFGTEADSASVAPEGSLEVVDVDVQPQLGRLGEHLLANPANRFTVFIDLEDFLTVGNGGSFLLSFPFSGSGAGGGVSFLR